MLIITDLTATQSFSEKIGCKFKLSIHVIRKGLYTIDVGKAILLYEFKLYSYHVFQEIYFIRTSL